MPVFTLIGDPHAKNDNLYLLDKVYDQAEALGNPIITLGDLLDTKSIVQSKCLNFYLKKLSESKLHHYVLVGNHDWHNNECSEHSLMPLKQLSNVTVVDTLIKVDNFILVPYMHDLDAFRKLVKPLANDQSVLVMHQGINGMDYGNGFIAENELNFEDIQGFQRVISGHFHKCQMEENLVYVGTPFSHSFGESDQSKCIATYNSDNFSLKFINTNLPQHYTHHINCDIKANIEEVYNFPKEDIHRVILSGKETNIHKFQKKLYPNVKFIEQPTVEVSGDNLKETDTPETTFLKWAKDIKKLDQKTIDLGLEILNGCR